MFPLFRIYENTGNVYHRNYPPAGDNGDIDLESAPHAKN
jgi:hypothetical protein